MQKAKPLPSSVRLAVCGPPKALAYGLRKPDRAGDPLPALLVSYVYLKQFDNSRHRYYFRDWVMDSGAFSAHNSGRIIDLAAYTELAKDRVANDPLLTEVYSLDVINDWRASEKNTEYMHAHGVPAIPTYHQGEPWDLLINMVKEYPKVGIGGMVGLGGKIKKDWIGQCFARVWAAVGPKKLHGLGVGGEELIMAFPFHSMDATNWEMGPTCFGRWASYGGASLRIRGGAHNLRTEVEHFLRMEDRARQRWAKEMARIDP